MAALDHGVGEVELAVEFERARLNGQGARGRAGLRRLVDDAHLDAELGEPERQDETGRAGADDQNIRIHHSFDYTGSESRHESGGLIYGHGLLA